MMYDLVQEKSKEIKEMAKKFGFTDVIAVESFGKEKKNTVVFSIPKSEQELVDVVHKAQKNHCFSILKVKKELWRKTSENKNVNALLFTQDIEFNHIILKNLTKNNIFLCFSLSEIIDHQNQEFFYKLHRIIKLGRKYKVSYLCGSFATTLYDLRSVHDILSLFITLGMNPGEAKTMLQNSLHIKQNNL